jgi:hypothetical protein
MEAAIQGRRIWFLAGLFFATLAALLLEILNTRFLSVSTWYHLSFFAVSLAMFGMSAGAVHVYLRPDRFSPAHVAGALQRYSAWFAVSIPVCHVLNLCIPIRIDLTFSLTSIAGAVVTTLIMSLPFYLAGVLVALALTRIPGRIGVVYSVDLIGAALGSLLTLGLLNQFDITSAMFVAGALAGAGTVCFARFAGSSQALRFLCLALVFLAAAGLNSQSMSGLRLVYDKEGAINRNDVIYEKWNSHSQILAYQPRWGEPFYWGRGEGADGLKACTLRMVIDGNAESFMTYWDGNPASLSWVQYDLTSLPYHLRRQGDAAIIGVGGGRDVLTALWARSRSVTGIEINDTFLYLLKGPLHDFAHIADRPDVTLIHDEARSYLTRAGRSFDVVQMSLIDTWASTSAGAFSLSENGLYTLEGWKVFLDALKPGGILSASRWFSAERASETSRLLALASAALLERGVKRPADHIALLSRGDLATLLVSPTPLSADDRRTLETMAAVRKFKIHLAPGRQPANQLLGRIIASNTLRELADAVENQVFDFSPPTDQRPYFFNMLKPGGVFYHTLEDQPGIQVRGNLLATYSLLLLGVIVVGLVVSLIFVPLWRSGPQHLRRLPFSYAVLYFACIGLGYMMVQIAYMQRFSVYLGHPIYAVAIILFSMILFTGIGSFVSDRVPVERHPGWLLAVPLAVAAALQVVVLTAQAIVDSSILLPLLPRCLIVVGLTMPVSFLLGFCFPFGMRLLGRVDDRAKPWMWGVNGACSVLSCILAVAISIWSGIHTNLYVAMALYLGLIIPALGLWRLGKQRRDSNASAGAVSLDSALRSSPGIL